MLPVLRLKHPDSPVLKACGTGSFDCIAVRFADGNSAQDDRHEWFRTSTLFIRNMGSP
jgi:hypothetical protein